MRKQGIYVKYLKRAADFLLSLLALIVLSPVFLIVAVLIRVDLGTPVIFRQERIGKDEKHFYMYKFRTMRDAVEIATGRKLTDAERLVLIETHGEAAVTSDAQRLTRLGRFLRATSIDELPELFNILRGDMSIIGPRPLVELYLPYYTQREHHRHDVRPGLTGLAQVNGRNSLSWTRRFAYDVQYVEQLSLMQDIKIFFKTVAVVFRRADVAQGEARPESFHVVRQREWDEEKLQIHT